MQNNALVLKFAADTASAQRAITQLATTGAAQVAGLAAASAAAGRKIDSGLLASLLKLAAGIQAAQVAYVAFGATAAAALAIAIDRMEQYRKVAAEAERAGVSTDFFQRFTQSAGAAKDKVDALANALKNARAATRDSLDSPSTAGGRLEEFNRNSEGSLSQFVAQLQAAASQEEKIRAVTAAIDELRARGDTLAALDLAEKLFGKAAADELIARADRAGQSLSAMIDATANKKIVSPEQVEEARKLEERLEAARKTMAEGMEPVMRDLERLGVALYSGWVSTEGAIAAAAKTLGGFYTTLRNSVLLLPSFQQLAGTAAQATSQAQLDNAERQIASLRRQGVGANDPDLARLTRLRDGYREQVFRAQGADQLARNGLPDIPLPPADFRVELGPNDPIAVAAAKVKKLLEERRNTGKYIGADDKKSSPRGSSGREEKDEYEKILANIEKTTAALEAEYRTLGLNRAERERAILLAKAEADLKEKGRTLTEEERANLEAKIEAQARYKMVIEDTKASMEKMKEFQNFIGQNVSGFLSDIISGGKNAEQALMNLTKRLADAALQALLLGQGPLAGLFGTQASGGGVGGLIGTIFGAFGGFRAEGGPVSAGVPYIVGERGPELFVPGASGGIVPNHALGGGGTINLHIMSDGTLPMIMRAEAQGVAIRVTQAAIRANNQKLPGMLAEADAR